MLVVLGEDEKSGLDKIRRYSAVFFYDFLVCLLNPAEDKVFSALRIVADYALLFLELFRLYPQMLSAHVDIQELHAAPPSSSDACTLFPVLPLSSMSMLFRLADNINVSPPSIDGMSCSFLSSLTVATPVCKRFMFHDA